MKKLLALFIFIALLSGNVSAQYYTNQNKVWAFGFLLGLDFTSGSPVFFTSSMDQGGASVSDTSGHLLFYTDGVRVWNKAGSVMPSGDSIAIPFYHIVTQPAAIVQVWNNPNQYYVFSVQNFEPNYAYLSYSIVDMTLDGGMGDVIAPYTGTLIDSLLDQKIITIPGNNCNMWVIVKKYGSANFLSYEITAAGINHIPVFSAVSSVHTFSGCTLKVSHDRLRIINNNSGSTPHGSELFDFDPNTGVLSNGAILDTIASTSAEFSPDNSKLYLNQWLPAVDSSQIAQYDLSQPTMAAITASRVVLKAGIFDDLKLAPDNKIYLTAVLPTTAHMDCINNPNLAGAACGYTTQVINLPTYNNDYGLPNTFWSVIGPSPIIGATSVCLGTTTTLSDASVGGSWSSNNTAIASVDPVTGIVTGTSPGIANITYTACSGFVTVLDTIQACTTGLPVTGVNSMTRP